MPSQGRSGGLWLLWADNVNLQIIQKKCFFIHAQVIEPNKPPWTLIGVYGDPHHALSSTIWQEIKKLVEIEDRCCFMGDFNSILSEQEKFGGRTRLNSSASLFRQFLFDTGLVDLGFRGPAYTWKNCQHTSTVIFQRLDRILISSSWSQAFPHAHVNHLPRIHSDHAPLLLRTHNQAIPKKKFKVERWWFEADGFRETCQNSWPSNQSLTWDYIITGMKKEIKEWSTSISTPQNRMTALKQDILKHQTLHPSMQN